MTDLSQNGYTHDQVIDILEAHSGVHRTRIALYLLKNGVKTEALSCHSLSIDCNAEADIKYSASMEFSHTGDIDWFQDRLQPFLTLEHKGILFEWPLTPPLTSGTRKESIYPTYTIHKISEAYDESSVIYNNSLSEALFFPKGTTYVSAITDVFTLSNFKQYNIFPTDKVLKVDAEFAEGNKHLSIINTLLKGINYVSLEPDKEGILISKPYQAPTSVNPEIRYFGGARSLLQYPIEREYDSFGKPNVFPGHTDNPDLEKTFRYVHTNESPSSPLSTTNLGYIITASPRNFSEASDQDTLDDAVLQWAEEETLSYETTTISSAVMPHHEVRDIISIHNEKISGIFEEVRWRIQATVDDMEMTHTVRSLYGD